MDAALQERIFSKSEPLPMAGCWIWTNKLNAEGYGRLFVGDKVRRAHRVSYEAFVGPIPAGLTIDHLCRVRCCVNPAHLETVTRRENIQRAPGWPKGWKRRITHCPSGHEYTAGNTGTKVLRATGKVSRYCRACHSVRMKAKYAASRKGAL